MIEEKVKLLSDLMTIDSSLPNPWNLKSEKGKELLNRFRKEIDNIAKGQKEIKKCISCKEREADSQKNMCSECYIYLK